MLRFLLVLAIVAAASATAVAYEAARQTDAAFATLTSPQSQIGETSAGPRLATAARRLEQNWARPLLWNAYANEAQSAIYARRFEVTGDVALLRQSAASARQALRLSPRLLQTWIRSAQLSLMGAPGVPCEALQCLEISWRIAPISDARTDCLRLQLAHRAGMDEGQLAPRIATYVRTQVSREAIVRCLTFLPPEQRLAHVLRGKAR